MNTLSTQPTLEQFARLDEKTAGELKHLGQKLDAWAAMFDRHVQEDMQLRRDFIEHQRQFDRMVETLNAINKQLAEVAFGFSNAAKESAAAIAVLRSDVEQLKSERAFRDREANRKDANVKRWVGVVGALSSVVGVAAGHFWK